jgi:molybdopterin converting factor small subunit
MATIRFLGVLAEKIGKKTMEVTLKNPIELKNLYPLPFQEEDVLILIEGRVGHLNSSIEDQDSIVIMPMLSGG